MTTPQMAKALGVSMRKVLAWVERGYLDKPGEGPGTKRNWTDDELEKARLIPGLEACFRPHMIRNILDFASTHPRPCQGGLPWPRNRT